MIRRGFWVALGLGAGATTAVLASRWFRRQAERVSPSNVGETVSEGARNLAALLRVSVAEGRRAMEEREAEIRGTLPG